MQQQRQQPPLICCPRCAASCRPRRRSSRPAVQVRGVRCCMLVAGGLTCTLACCCAWMCSSSVCTCGAAWPVPCKLCCPAADIPRLPPAHPLPRCLAPCPAASAGRKRTAASRMAAFGPSLPPLVIPDSAAATAIKSEHRSSCMVLATMLHAWPPKSSACLLLVGGWLIAIPGVGAVSASSSGRHRSATTSPPPARLHTLLPWHSIQ